MVLTACRKLMPAEFTSAIDLHAKKTAKIQFITSGAKAVDELLGGGVETSSLTEIFVET
jgi:DNA repair protein RadA